jgi:hypothetical protein
LKNAQRLLMSFIAIAFAGFALAAAVAGTAVQTATPQEVKSYFRQSGMWVLTFVGYSGAGYQDVDRMLGEVTAILERYDPNKTIVNIGATADGIGAAYPLARQKGFRTTGIVSTQARDSNVPPSASVDRVFYVPDETWGGFIAGTHRLSPTSLAMVESSDVMVAIGGGDVARDELTAAKELGKDVRFIPADMNHQKAIDAARRKGAQEPTDFRGAAAAAFAR